MWSLPRVTNHSTVMFWNLWEHRLPEALHKHIAEHMPEVDAFCFTGVTHVKHQYSYVPTVHTSDSKTEAPSQLNGLDQLRDLMQEKYNGRYHSPELKDWVCRQTRQTYRFVRFGSALMYRNDLAIVDTGNKLICQNFTELSPRVLQWIVYQKGVMRYLVAHLHGVWIPDNTKGDHPARIFQSHEVHLELQYLIERYLVDRVVFGGDLNLDINTRAMSLLLDGSKSVYPYRNLIAEHNVTSTRTPLYRKYGMVGKTMHADHVIVSPKIKVHSFKVGTDILASDHAPLLVEFS